MTNIPKTRKCSAERTAPGVAAVVAALPDCELDRMVSYAFFRLRRAGGNASQTDPRDLVQEAILRTLDGRRAVNPKIPFVSHLCGCISSIAHQAGRKARKSIALSDVHGCKANIDAEVDRKIIIDRLRTRLRTDPAALNVMESLLRGLSPKEAGHALNINSKLYWAARKRISRQCARLFPPSQEH
jgi:DNA-directed RNA polymerase specialized sigma24 family protein